MRRVIAIIAITAFAAVLTPTAAAGGGCHWESAEWTAQASDASEVTAHIAGCRFEPTTLRIRPGTTVTWLNKDYAPHTVTGPFLTLGSDKLLNRGDSTSVTFDDEGVYPYYCVVHPGMAASVVVGDPEMNVTGVIGMNSSSSIASGIYDSDSPIKGGSQNATSDETSMVPLAVGISGIAFIALASLAVALRRRRRTALPVPGAMP